MLLFENGKLCTLEGQQIYIEAQRPLNRQTYKPYAGLSLSRADYEQLSRQDARRCPHHLEELG